MHLEQIIWKDGDSCILLHISYSGPNSYLFNRIEIDMIDKMTLITMKFYDDSPHRDISPGGEIRENIYFILTVNQLREISVGHNVVLKILGDKGSVQHDFLTSDEQMFKDFFEAINHK